MCSKIPYTPGGNVNLALLGENILPEVVNSQRRSMRDRLRNLRDPVQSFRINSVPGPNIVGDLEDRFVEARDSFVTQDNILSRLQDIRGDSMTANNGNNGSSDESGESGETSRRSQANNQTLQ